jgi:hypothetical protein
VLHRELLEDVRRAVVRGLEEQLALRCGARDRLAPRLLVALGVRRDVDAVLAQNVENLGEVSSGTTACLNSFSPTARCGFASKTSSGSLRMSSISSRTLPSRSAGRP